MGGGGRKNAIWALTFFLNGPYDIIFLRIVYLWIEKWKYGKIVEKAGDFTPESGERENSSKSGSLPLKAGDLESMRKKQTTQVKAPGS